ncbi:hypothetical protein J2I47_06155 [Fibrella sp. HMF5335]|uniref:Peptidase MA superfamily protein n=1 Tax=Fibrella rubiginis TaxID=2817060 RepID=A0A939GGP3_9BACT|nr:hypothetical protein [Fibrella rubiginis]MBO0936123.1 hypothetical protein [Fibrella rubiginis]
MRWSVLLRWSFSLLIALPLAALLLFPSLWRCLTIQYSPRFVVQTENNRTLYISQDASARQRDVLLAHFEQANDRIRQFWGKSEGRALVIYCPTQDQYAQYCSGGEGAGCSLGMPWGDSFLVLGPDGNNVDVMAHELCHDELFARLGWFTIKRQVPQWFNEGLALMVDYRFTTATNSAAVRFLEYDAQWNYRAHGPSGLSPQFVPELSSLETTRDFFYGDYGRVMLAYLTAGREVSRWMATTGSAALTRLLADLQAGESFDDVYQYAHKKKTAGKAAPSGSAH